MSKEIISFRKALALSLGDHFNPLISVYDLGLVIFHLFKHAAYKGSSVGLPKLSGDYPHAKFISQELTRMLDEGLLELYPAITIPAMYVLLGRVASSPAEIACSADPFCYVSHLSAMEHHGLTDRVPTVLHITRPSSKEWYHAAQARAQRDFGDDYELVTKLGLPMLRRPQFHKRIGNRLIIEFNSIHHGAFRTVQGSPLRVATLGRTYLDMLTQPQLCGGIIHVLSVFEQHAATQLSSIVDEVNRHGRAIDKVRAGYILQERCNLQHPAFIEWQRLAVRGGSRKLDPKGEYSPRYSEKWCLSINIEEPLDEDSY